MGKLCLIFAIMFIVVQLSFGGRISRDTSSSEESGIMDSLNSAYKNLMNKVQNTFNEDTLKKVGNDLQEFGGKVKSTAAEILSKVNEKSDSD